MSGNTAEGKEILFQGLESIKGGRRGLYLQALPQCTKEGPQPIRRVPCLPISFLVKNAEIILEIHLDGIFS